MTDNLKHFDILVKCGLKVIPIKENSKAPICSGWQNWDEAHNRDVILANPDCNLGLLLGDIIDVEGDTEEANERVLKMIGNYPHPCYRSSKSIHHLFASPHPSLRIFKFENIEFRGHGHQSVLPPSQHQGVRYRWLSVKPFPVPPMPPRLQSFLMSRWTPNKTKSQFSECRSIHCNSCAKKKFVHKKRLLLELEVFKSIGLSWECNKCRKLDVRHLVRELRNS